MARMAVADGITHVVCSPHANSQYEYASDVVAGKIDELQWLLEEEGVALKLGRGCDFHLSYENIQDAKAEPTKFSINGLGYLLVEIPDYGVPRGLTEIFYQLQLAGMTPILTHPERNPTLQADQQRLVEWLRGGVLIQVTAGSVLGHMGKRAERMAHQLLENRWVHFLATDAHNITRVRLKCMRLWMPVRRNMGPTMHICSALQIRWQLLPGVPCHNASSLSDFMRIPTEKSWWQKLLSKSSQLESQTAIYSEELAGDEGGCRSEEEGSSGYIICRAVALHGCLVGEVLVSFADLTLHDHAGGYAIDTDLRRPGLCHRLGEHVQGSLGGAVVSMSGPGMRTAK